MLVTWLRYGSTMIVPSIAPLCSAATCDGKLSVMVETSLKATPPFFAASLRDDSGVEPGDANANLRPLRSASPLYWPDSTSAFRITRP